jgi:lipopolysaccharide transport system permease protein
MNQAYAEAAAGPEIVIAPPGRWSTVKLRELWTHRELVYFLTKRELQVRYKQSFFGVSWAVLQPLVFAFVLALFFSKFLGGLPTEGFPYAVFAVVGLVPWMFTSTAVQNGATSLVQDANLISKVYFPRLALPISKALSLVVDLAIAIVVVLIVVPLYGVSIEPTVFLAPAFLALGLLTAFALGTLFAAMNVKYRDVGVVVPVLVQILFFATPILYSGQTLVTGAWKYVWALNPLVSVIEGLRWAIIGAHYPGTAVILISVGSALVMLLIALRYFQRTEQFFADVI